MTSSVVIDTALSYIVFCVVYIISTTLSGCFRAWLASRYGDDTAREQGFITLDMTQHIDFLGLMSIVFVGFGWGAYVPVVIENIRGYAAGLKRFLVLYADTFLHIGIVALFYYTYLHGVTEYVLSPVCGIFSLISDSCSSVSNIFDFSVLGLSGRSYWQALDWFREGFIRINLMLASVTLIVNTVRIAVKDFLSPWDNSWTDHILVFLLTFMLIMLLHKWVAILIVTSINGIHFLVWSFAQAIRGIMHG